MEYKSKAVCSTQWSLEISLMDDYKEKLYNYLLRAGIKDADRENVVYQYWNMEKRIIPEKPRNVVYSAEFQCPEGYERALAEFEERIRKGDNIHPFMSEKILRSSYNDLLLNDWNIYHFHLTRRFREDGFAQRNKYEIFAYVTDDTFYMIQVYLHSEENLYSKQEMVRIIRDNWPELLEKFHMKDINCLYEKLNDSMYEVVRKSQMLSLVELGTNEVFGMIGGGYASNGYSLEALRRADFWDGRVRVFQQIVIDNAGKIFETMESNYDRNCGCYMNVKLLWIDDPDKVTLLEKVRKLIIQIEIKKNRIRICEPYEVFQTNRILGE